MLAHPDLGFVESGFDFLSTASYGACRAPYGVASRLPARAYTSPVFQDLENEKVWTRDWVCIGSAAEIAVPGDLLPYTIGEHAIHVQRLASGGLIGRFNKAQHGGCRSVPAQCRTGKKTRCSYTSCGHSRDRDVIPGDQLNEMTPQVGQYLGVYPERLMPVSIVSCGPFLFANVDPSLDRDARPPVIEWEGIDRLVRVGGDWQEHRVNWKLAGAALLESARALASPGAPDPCTAEWYFPNLVVIRTGGATLAVVLQPTAFNQTLWRLSLFSDDRSAEACDQAHERLKALLPVAAARAVSLQAEAEAPTVCDDIEPSHAAWSFNQQLMQRITAMHAAFWNAPLTHAAAGR